MMFTASKTLLLILSLAVAISTHAQTVAPTPINLAVLENDEELKTVYLGIANKYIGQLSSQLWTLTHAYDSKEEVDKALDYFIEFMKAVESNDPEQIKVLGGAKGFKEKFAEFLDSKDQAVKGFSAFILGASGDKSYAPKLAELINHRDPSFEDRFAGDLVFYRGRAAIALGMLNATEHKTDISKLLKSKNEYDRSGAIFALADMDAKEFTREIVGILKNKEFEFPGDESPIYFLVKTGEAKNYKKDIAEVMLSTRETEVAESSAYALVALDAKEHAKDIAKLLNKEFRKRSAAKALALMNATEYADHIAFLLKDENSLVRSAAALSLGILKSKKHIPDLASILLSDEAEFVRNNAAVAIFFLEADKYYKEALKEVEDGHKGVYLSEIDFHPFVLDKVKSLGSELERKIESAKRTLIK